MENIIYRLFNFYFIHNICNMQFQKLPNLVSVNALCLFRISYKRNDLYIPNCQQSAHQRNADQPGSSGYKNRFPFEPVIGQIVIGNIL